MRQIGNSNPAACLLHYYPPLSEERLALKKEAGPRSQFQPSSSRGMMNMKGTRPSARKGCTISREEGF